MARYPQELAGDVETLTGSTVRVRPIRPDDGPGLIDFHSRLSPRSTYRRFFNVHPRLSTSEVERFTHVDYVDRLALVAVDDDHLVAVARYDRDPDTTEAEVAFVVADDYQHHGIATLLLEQLASAAWGNGITTFVASTLVENREMLGVFVNSGFPVTTSREDDTIVVRFSIEPDEARRVRIAGRHSPQTGTRRRDDEGTAAP